MRLDRGCYERGCACVDDRIDKDVVDVAVNQTPREEALIIQIRDLIQKDVKNEIMQLERKLKTVRQQRDKWHEAATRYRKQLLEERKKREQRI